MKAEDLFYALGGIGDDLIVEAQTKKFSQPWKRWGSLAAVVAVVVCAGLMFLPKQAEKTAESAAVTEEACEEAAELPMMITEAAEEEAVYDMEPAEYANGIATVYEQAVTAVEEGDDQFLLNLLYPEEKAKAAVQITDARWDGRTLYLTVQTSDTVQYAIKFTEDGNDYQIEPLS